MFKNWHLIEEATSNLVKVVSDGTDRDLVNHLESMSSDLIRSVATHIAKFGETMLHLAALRERLNGLRAMLKNKADVNARNGLGYSPLHTCLNHNCKSSARLLLDYGADANEVVCRQRRESLLHRMIKANRALAVDILLEASAQTDTTTKDGDTPLHYAARYNRPKMAMALISMGADINATNLRKETPLHVSITNGSLDVAKVLVKSSANTIVKDRQGMTALHSAVVVNAVELVRLILNNNSTNVNSKETLLGRTPLLLACANGNEKMVALLLSCGADANLTNNFRKSVLHVAATSGKAEVLNAVIKHSKNPNALAINNKTPLHNAVVEGYVDIVKLLLRAGVNINTKDIDGNTALHMASYAGSDQLVSILLQNGAQVNGTNMLHQTALHLAFMTGHEKTGWILIESGCNPEIMDIKDKKARDYLVELGQNSIENEDADVELMHETSTLSNISQVNRYGAQRETTNEMEEQTSWINGPKNKGSNLKPKGICAIPERKNGIDYGNNPSGFESIRSEVSHSEALSQHFKNDKQLDRSNGENEENVFKRKNNVDLEDVRKSSSLLKNQEDKDLYRPHHSHRKLNTDKSSTVGINKKLSKQDELQRTSKQNTNEMSHRLHPNITQTSTESVKVGM